MQKKLKSKANSENCGPPPGNNFDLEVGQCQGRGMVPIEKGLSQGSFKYFRRYEPVFVTDRQTEGRTDGRMSFYVPDFTKAGDKKDGQVHCENICKTILFLFQSTVNDYECYREHSSLNKVCIRITPFRITLAYCDFTLFLVVY